MEASSTHWGDAWQIAGVGFGVVFIVLIILAVAIWITGIVVNRIEAKNNNKQTEEKKAS